MKVYILRFAVAVAILRHAVFLHCRLVFIFMRRGIERVHAMGDNADSGIVSMNWLYSFNGRGISTLLTRTPYCAASFGSRGA